MNPWEIYRLDISQTGWSGRVSEWRTWTYCREHVKTGNRLMMSLVDGKARYVVLVRDGAKWNTAYQGIDVEEAKRIAEGK